MNAKPVSLFVVIAALFWACAVEAAPIHIRMIEGNFRGFRALHCWAGLRSPTAK